MKKRLGMFATLIAALFAVIQPAAAQDRDEWNRGRFDHDRNHFVQPYGYRPEPDWRAREYREQAFREQAFRERAWRERELRERDRYGYGYRAPVPSFGFQYYGR